jgi:hypothetical protein
MAPTSQQTVLRSTAHLDISSATSISVSIHLKFATVSMTATTRETKLTVTR